MAFRHFPGKNQDWLEAKLNKILEDIVAGKTTSEWEADGLKVGKHVHSTLPPERIRDMLLHDLHLEDPDTYPADGLQVKITTAIFRDV